MPQYVKVLKLAFVIGSVFFLLVWGCAGPPQKKAQRVPDRKEQGSASPEFEEVIPAPSIAAPPESVSDTFVHHEGTNSLLTPSEGVEASANEAKQLWIDAESWARSKGMPGLTTSTISGLDWYEFHAGDQDFVFRPGSLLAQWSGVEVRLGFAPRLIAEEPYLHELDLEKTILPLLSNPGPPQLTGPIIIDAGHGGDDPGTHCINSGTAEKELTLDWAFKLEAVLVTNGFNVLLTRRSDIAVPLSTRVQIANQSRACLFLSLHFNSAGAKESESGIETYTLTPAGQPSSITRGYNDDPGQNFPNNAFDEQNIQLAGLVHKAILEITATHDRGIRRARFPAVLRGPVCPAILIEGGYLSNDGEARKIQEANYRQMLAEAVRNGVVRWCGKQ